MRIYTGSGDKGETGLLGGRRISKASQRIEAIGHIDELNASIGLARAHPHVATDEALDETLRTVQNKLFHIGAHLAGDEKQASGLLRRDVDDVENMIDRMSDNTPPITQFILPAGDEGACRLHLCRTIARRAERALVGLNETYSVGDVTLVYVNRLSDLLFVAARYINFLTDTAEQYWTADQ